MKTNRNTPCHRNSGPRNVESKDWKGVSHTTGRRVKDMRGAIHLKQISDWKKGGE